MGRLWESFPPARALTALVASDGETGFLVINVSLVAFGVWCLVWPIRRRWRSAVPLAWGWVAIQLVNGVGHPVWSIRQGGYTPGLLTAPILLVVALLLAADLRREARSSFPT